MKLSQYVMSPYRTSYQRGSLDLLWKTIKRLTMFGCLLLVLRMLSRDQECDKNVAIESCPRKLTKGLKSYFNNHNGKSGFKSQPKWSSVIKHEVPLILIFRMYFCGLRK